MNFTNSTPQTAIDLQCHLFMSSFFIFNPACHTLGTAVLQQCLSDPLTHRNGLHHGPQTHTGPSGWVNLKIKFPRYAAFKPVKTWLTSKAASKHGQKDRSFLLASAHPGERRGPNWPTYRTRGHSDLFYRLRESARDQLFSLSLAKLPHCLYCQAPRSSLAYSLSITIG